jgi:cysteinyl-tRNA synthetase
LELEQSQKALGDALVSSFDTPRAMLVILKLVNTTNLFISENKDFDLAHVEAVARWITKMAGIFGLDALAEPPYNGIGWASAIGANVDPETAVQPFAAVLAQAKADIKSLSVTGGDALEALLAHDPTPDFKAAVEKGSRNIEKLSLPYLRGVSKLRDELRRIVGSQAADAKKALLALTDRIRDQDLTNIGVYLDDRPDNQPSLIKFIPAAELIAAREEKAAQVAEKARKKEEARLAKEKADREAREKAKVPAEELFKSDERYSAWDEQGLPTKMKDGSDVTKNQQKSLKKLWDKQKKAHDDLKKKGGL